jgi:hypothetical protein
VETESKWDVAGLKWLIQQLYLSELELVDDIARVLFRRVEETSACCAQELDGDRLGLSLFSKNKTVKIEQYTAKLFIPIFTFAKRIGVANILINKTILISSAE